MEAFSIHTSTEIKGSDLEVHRIGKNEVINLWTVAGVITFTGQRGFIRDLASRLLVEADKLDAASRSEASEVAS